MKINHIGAKSCVTGSCHLIQAAEVNLLVDCGIAQGHDPVLPFDQWPVPPATVDYLFLTHAHIDHTGRVPDLIDAGFAGEILCTHATKALLSPMLRDAMSFSDRSDTAVRAMEARIDDLSWGFELYDTFTLKSNITFTLKNAGHILGSCFIQFSFPGGPGSAPTRVTFSGDLGCRHTPILPDPDLPDSCDLLILESTYGDRNHENRADRQAALAKALDHALSDSGIVYIPAFALGRTQELIYELDRINPGVPVFIDSPLGVEITRLYQDMDDCWDKEAKTLKAAGDHPIRFKHLYAVERFKDHRRLLDLKGPAIIIAGSGMCTGGRIVNHLKHGLDDPKNDLFFVGYQAAGTPGRAILEGRTPSKAAIHGLTGYSAHADQQTLAAWVAAMPDPPGEIRLVHGEPKAQTALAKRLNT
ncbi:MBL fold metallo-hydrolase [Desulfotignum phosphitoxidans]|uniref:Putative exonuclease of the beta-lactamase fold involved in RNA n=1 Tax=Desulfotignum phosphitoxidans DSM 13687 TaxID=1286635 RepID=S0FWV9_9BACT|nr:MBL fold metallo-hydrolase [Desulfotignum phosphitoxidans]EMS77629.1 putative exonuclease of the beta-lactamase fold involved in RNA [Desulfotignum phosphitoxidans DSM 13687]